MRNIGINLDTGFFLKDIIIKKKGETIFSCKRIDTNIKILDLFKKGRKELVLNLIKPFILIRTYPFPYIGHTAGGVFFISDGNFKILDEIHKIEILFKRAEGEIRVTEDTREWFVFSRYRKGYMCMRGRTGGNSNIWEIRFVNYPVRETGLKLWNYRIVDGKLSGKINFTGGNVTGDIFIKDGKMELKGRNLQEIRFSGGFLLNRHRVILHQWSVRIADTGAKIKGVLTRGEVDLELLLGKVTVLISGPSEHPHFVYKKGRFNLDLFPDKVDFDRGYISLRDITGTIKYGSDLSLDVDIRGVKIHRDRIVIEDAVFNKCIKLSGYISEKGYFIRCRFSGSPEQGFSFPLCPADLKGIILFWSNLKKDFARGRLKSSFFKGIALIRKGQEIFLDSTGGPISLKGKISINQHLKLTVDGIISEMDLSQLINIFGKRASGIGGKVWGSYRISGRLSDPDIFIRLRIKDGHIGEKEFQIANLNLRGGLDKLDFYESTIYTGNMTAEVKGSLKIGEKDLFEGLDILPIGDRMFWQGLNIYTDRFDDGIGVRKDVGEKVVVDIKHPSTNNQLGIGEESSTEIQLRYKVDEDKNVLFRMEKDESTVGIEHKVKF